MVTFTSRHCETLISRLPVDDRVTRDRNRSRTLGTSCVQRLIKRDGRFSERLRPFQYRHSRL